MRFQVSFEKDLAVKTLIAECLTRHGLPLIYNDEGYLETVLPELPADLKNLRAALSRYHIFLVDNKKDELVAAIKNIVNRQLVTKDRHHVLSTIIEEKLGKKYSQVARLFVRQTGYSIESYYVAHKIELAKQMLTNGELSFKEIAFVLNYCSLGHFSRQFKRQTGLTLSLFKRIVDSRLNHKSL